MKKNIMYRGTLLMAIIACCIIFSPLRVKAGDGSTLIKFSITSNCTIENAEGKVLKYSENGFTGDMKVLARNFINEDPPEVCVWVENSDKYIFRTSYTGKVEFSVLGEKMSGYVEGTNISEAGIWMDGGTKKISVKGNDCKYLIGGWCANSPLEAEVSGTTSNQIQIADTKAGVVVSGATEKIKIKTDNEDGVVSGSFYATGGDILIKRQGSKLSAKGAPGINGQTSAKSISSVYLCPMNGGKDLFLTWRKVKNAKSYNVYQYNYATKKYKKVATRPGKASNYYAISNVSNGETYRYVVKASQMSSGNGKYIGKSSDWVLAVAGNHTTKGNAASIKINKKLVKGKAGKKAGTLKAILSSGSDKDLLSKSIRWYSSNKKIAKIDKKTGKLTFVKKGTCYVYAKAHNGKDSKRVKVVVK